jgi:hypothetical protein
MSGDVLLFEGTSLLARLTRLVTRSRYSHAGIAIWWMNRLFVLHATEWHGVQLTPVSKTSDFGSIAWFRAKRHVDLRHVVSHAADLLGERYSFGGYLKIGLSLLLGRQRGGPEERTRGLFCSQFVAESYRRAGQDLVPGSPDHLTTPHDLASSPHLYFASTVSTESKKWDS